MNNSPRRRSGVFAMATRLGVAVALVSICAPVFGQVAIYVVRHAEKQSDSGDTPLSDAGFKRAEALAGLLKMANVGAIYTSDALRTQQTAKPLAEQRNIVPVVIPRGDVAATFEQIRINDAHRIVLIVGHSNTIGEIVRKWAPDAEIEIRPKEFNKIFVVTAGDSESGWVEFEYGSDNP